MEPARPTRILVVANRTASTPVLLDEIGRRARAAPCTFALLIPDAPGRKGAGLDAGGRDPAARARGAEARCTGVAGGPDTFEAVERAVREGDFDEIIVATLPRKRSRWRRRDLVRQIAGLGLPVTAVVLRQKSIIDVLDDSISMEVSRSAAGGAAGQAAARFAVRQRPGAAPWWRLKAAAKANSEP